MKFSKLQCLFSVIALGAYVVGCGSPIGTHIAARNWEEEGKYSLALEDYKRAANMGHLPAYMDVARFYAEGKGTYSRPDYNKAMDWYRKAAEKDYVPAQRALAELYLQGKGVPQDYQTAVGWYKRAAEQGDVSSQYLLGELYHTGEAVVRDDKEAVMWYMKAAEQGHDRAHYRIAELYNIILPPASKYTKAAEQGDAQGQYTLAKRYRTGYGVSMDYSQAAKWYLKSAEQNFAPAQFALGYYDSDYEQMVKWYTKAAEQGFTPALRALGYCYVEGLGVDPDYAIAYKWLNLAAVIDGEAAEVKAQLVERMTATQILEGQRLSAEFLKEKSLSPSDIGGAVSSVFEADFVPSRPPKPTFDSLSPVGIKLEIDLPERNEEGARYSDGPDLELEELHKLRDKSRLEEAQAALIVAENAADERFRGVNRFTDEDYVRAQTLKFLAKKASQSAYTSGDYKSAISKVMEAIVAYENANP